MSRGSKRTYRERLEATREQLGPDREAINLLRDLRGRIGPDSPLLPNPVATEVMPCGRVVIHGDDGLVFSRDERDGTPVASRVRGGRAESAQVEPDGRMNWTLTPLGDVANN